MRSKKFVAFMGAPVLIGTLSSCSLMGVTVDPLSDGRLDVGVSIQYPPMEFYDDETGKPAGIDIELVSELANRIDADVNIVDSSWDSLMPGVQSGRYDVAISSIGDFEDRRLKLDFVDYLEVQSGVIAKVDTAQRVEAAGNVCGLTVGVTRGSVAVDIANGYSEECESNGNKPVEVSQFQNGSTGLVSLKSDRIDAQILDGPAAVYQAETVADGSQFDLIMEGQGPVSTYGIAVSKNNTELRDRLQDALQSMIDDGTYLRILERHKIKRFAVSSAEINAGGSKS